MALVGTDKGTSFTPHPKGIFAGTVIDIVDIGNVTADFGEGPKTQRKFWLRVYCGQQREDGMPLYAQRRLSLSTNEKAAARLLVQKGRDKEFTKEEEKEFDYESLIGQSFMFFITHNNTPKGIFANIDTMAPLGPGQAGPGIPDSYVREVNQPPEKSKDVRVAGVSGVAQAVAAAKPKASEQEQEYTFPLSDHDKMPWDEA